KGLVMIHNDRELAFFSDYISDAIIQEQLLPDDQEYTVGVVLRKDGKSVGSLALKRSLLGGLSYRMESNPHDVVCKDACTVAIQAAQAMGVIGAVNVQMRLTATGFKVFEINPRFSSATCIRANFRFNEPELVIRHFVLGEEVVPPIAQAGICLRFWEEIYLPLEAKQAAQQGKYSDRGQILNQF
ncbi:MAG TPA: ATP-grasp domain-containing protein, partial [Allocoleopsis sp.]